jgi:hypothetical protein
LHRYNQLSEYNNGERQAVLFLGRQFGRDPATGQFRLLDAQMLTREQINELCDGGVDALQRVINDAVDETKSYRDQLSGNQYGTDVHSRVEDKIKDPDPKLKDIIKDKNFIPEISFVKNNEEALDPNSRPPYKEGNRGEKGSIRLDVLQPILEKRTVCIHDLKTLRKGLSPARIRELGRRVFDSKEYHDKVDLVVVTEARPSDGWRMGRRPKP